MGELWVTPVLVEHTVPTTGFVIHDGETGFVFSGDTGPTKRIWQIAREMRGPQGADRRDRLPQPARDPGQGVRAT